MPGPGPIQWIRLEEGVRVQARAQHIPDVGVTEALLPHTTRVSVDLFTTCDVPVLAGRAFTTADLGTTNVIVKRSVVESTNVTSLNVYSAWSGVVVRRGRTLQTERPEVSKNAGGATIRRQKV